MNHVNKRCYRCEEQKMELPPSRRQCLLIKPLQQGNRTPDGRGSAVSGQREFQAALENILAI